LVVEQSGVICRSAFQIAGAAAAYAEQFRSFGSLFPRTANASEALLYGYRDGAGYAFAGLLGESLRELVSSGSLMFKLIASTLAESPTS
jgi:hypothetical protein